MEKAPASLDIWSVLILVSILHSVFVLSLMLIKRVHTRKEGQWLLGTLVFLIWMQLEFLSIRWPFTLPLPLFYGTRHGAWLAFGPLLYGYLHHAIGPPLTRPYLYFIPFILFTLMLPVITEDLLSWRQVHYGMLTPFDNRPDTLTGWHYIYGGVFVLQFVYSLSFTLAGRRLIQRYRQKLEGEHSKINGTAIRWLNTMLIGTALIMVIVTLFIGLLFFTEIYRRDMDYFYILPITVLIYLLSYQLAGVNWQKTSTEENGKYQKSGLKSDEVIAMQTHIKQALEEEKLYLNPELRLKDLAVAANTKTHHLSEVLNTHMGISFFDLINQYRVEEAKRRIIEHPNHKLLQIAFDAGFNNKTSFVNAFKKFEGHPPSAYVKKVLSEV